MDANTKVGVIIGCSLGIAALIFIIVLLMVCLCARKSNGKNSRNSNESTGKATLESDPDKTRNEGPSNSPGEPTHFIRTGSQLWRTNLSLAAISPLGVATVDKIPASVGSQDVTANRCDNTKPANTQSNLKQHKLPWYERTLARAGHFIIHRPVSYTSKKDSRDDLVRSKEDQGTGIKSFSNPNDQISAADRYVSTSSSESSGNAYVIYGSQTALLPDDDVTVSQDRRGRGLGSVNRAYVTEQNRTSEQYELKRDRALDKTQVDKERVDRVHASRAEINRIKNEMPVETSINNLRSVQTLIRRFESKTSADIPSRQSSEGQYLSPRDLRKECNMNSIQNYKEATSASSNQLPPSTQIYAAISKPITSASSQYVSREIVSANPSPTGKHPTRPDTPMFNPHGVTGTPTDRWQQNESYVEGQYATVGGVMEGQPRYVNYLNSYSEEKRIQDAFKFLDDMEE